MQLSNDYQNHVSNGELGVVSHIITKAVSETVIVYLNAF
jgi:ATP-dependent exoDNAse (exonuclease V) alpha subunit